MLDEGSQELHFNLELLSTTIENIPQAVRVVDRDLRLVSWNRRYQELFEYPDGMLYVGRGVADLIRYNAERGELGPGDIDVQVEKRVAYLRQGSAHVSEQIGSASCRERERKYVYISVDVGPLKKTKSNQKNN